MFQTRFGLARVLLAAALIVVPTTVVTPATRAYADCGDPGQEPCTGPVPTVDDVLAILAKLTDPNISDAEHFAITVPVNAQLREHPWAEIKCPLGTARLDLVPF